MASNSVLVNLRQVLRRITDTLTYTGSKTTYLVQTGPHNYSNYVLPEQRTTMRWLKKQGVASELVWTERNSWRVEARITPTTRI